MAALAAVWVAAAASGARATVVSTQRAAATSSRMGAGVLALKVAGVLVPGLVARWAPFQYMPLLSLLHLNDVVVSTAQL